MGAVLVGATALTACESDYLDTKPTDSVSAEGAMSSTDNAFGALNGLAKTMTTQHYYHKFAGEDHIIRLYEEMPSQNWNYNAYASGWAPLHKQEFHNRTNSIYDSYAWYYYYQLVGQANTIIAKIDNATGTQAERDFIKASALTFRAYAFEKMIHYYCYRWEDSNDGKSQGLVLRLDESTGDMPYSTLAETYTQIYKDLDDAIALFRGSDYERSAKEFYIANENVAHAVKARAALTKHDYTTALSEAKLARAGYELMDNEDYAAGFNAPTSEWIFGSYNSEKENKWYWSYYTQETCNGYYATNSPNGTATIGRELINRIPDTDFRKSLFLTDSQLKAGLAKRGLDLTDDQIFDFTYGEIGAGDASDSICEEIHDVADSIVKTHGAQGAGAPYLAEAYYIDAQFKFWAADLPGIGSIPFIRSSEMVLIEAEANYYLGNTTDAQNSLVELNATSGRNPGYTCTKTGDELLAEIQDYRELELWGEGFSWSDFKRWNKDVVRHTFAQGGNAHPAVAVTIKADGVNKWTWDVPLNETDYNLALKENAEKPE